MHGTDSSASEVAPCAAAHVSVTRDTLTVDLVDGRTLRVPLAWYPRLLHATQKERNHWKLTGRGEGIHWPDIDEDIRVAGLLAGHPSRESRASLEEWLSSRRNRRSSRSTQSGARRT